MGVALLHHPWVQFYLLCVSVMWVACIWDYLSGPPGPADERPVRPKAGPGPQPAGRDEEDRLHPAAGSAATGGVGFLTFLGGDGI
jgi:hypothetical protein